MLSWLYTLWDHFTSHCHAQQEWTNKAGVNLIKGVSFRGGAAKSETINWENEYIKSVSGSTRTRVSVCFFCVRKDLWFLLQDCQCWAPLWAPCFPAGAASGSQTDDELWSLKLSAAAGSICSLLDYCRHKERGRDSMRKIKIINAGMTVFLKHSWQILRPCPLICVAILKIQDCFGEEEGRGLIWALPFLCGF